jgi:glycogen debranching enzyme
MQLLAERFEEKQLAQDYSGMAELAKESFNDKFWNTDRGCLFDVIEDSGKPDFSIRPNQIIAAALDFPVIKKEKASQVVDFVQKELLTPIGLRTLPPNDSRYKGRYEGDRNSRDLSYHSGSIWPWQSGPLTTAYLKTNGYTSVNMDYAYQTFLKPLFTSEINRGGLSTLNEIFDADPPFTPRGCIAQAWSVAEPLRAYIEDVLQIRPKYEKDVVGSKVAMLVT